ncbi:hypothetical protein [Nonomuraea salmonea]|uniref:hypothetical protein n=1 Tax=Nonomuraea salmonea TaxID=46181 RepID=UPI002FE712BD
MSRSTLAAGAALAALAAVLVVTVSGPPRLGWYLAAWALFAAALWAARRLPERRLGPLVLAGGIVLAATGLTAPPSSSTDSFRYVWDGQVQAAGISPYAHAPSDPALAGLRDPWLFPKDCEGLYPLPDGGCTRINRPTVPTIYPPLAQGYFLLVHWLSPEGSGQQPLQVAGFLLAVGGRWSRCTGWRGRAGPRRGRGARPCRWRRSTTRTSTCWACCWWCSPSASYAGAARCSGPPSRPSCYPSPHCRVPWPDP